MAYLVNVGFLLLFLFSFAPANAEDEKFFDEVQIGRFDGNQPWYQLTIKKDGSAEFQRFDGAQRGSPSVHLTPKQLDEITKAIRTSDFFAMKDTPMNQFHMPVVTISVKDMGKEHAATSFGIMSPKSPIEVKHINRLALKIERIAGVDKLVNASSWYWPLMELLYWSIVGVPLCALIFLSVWFKKRAASKSSKIVALSSVILFSFLLVSFSGIYALARVSKLSVPTHCYELSEDGWKHCGG